MESLRCEMDRGATRGACLRRDLAVLDNAELGRRPSTIWRCPGWTVYGGQAQLIATAVC